MQHFVSDQAESLKVFFEDALNDFPCSNPDRLMICDERVYAFGTVQFGHTGHQPRMRHMPARRGLSVLIAEFPCTEAKPQVGHVQNIGVLHDEEKLPNPIKRWKK